MSYVWKWQHDPHTQKMLRANRACNVEAVISIHFEIFNKRHDMWHPFYLIRNHMYMINQWINPSYEFRVSISVIKISLDMIEWKTVWWWHNRMKIKPDFEKIDSIKFANNWPDICDQYCFWINKSTIKLSFSLCRNFWRFFKWIAEMMRPKKVANNDGDVSVESLMNYGK